MLRIHRVELQQVRKTLAVSFRVSPEVKNRTNKIVASIAEKKSISKGDAFTIVINEYEKVQLDNVIYPDKHIPHYIEHITKDIMKDVSCDFIEFVDGAFYCYEKFNKTKKKDILGIDASMILISCSMCKLGKSKEI